MENFSEGKRLFKSLPNEVLSNALCHADFAMEHEILALKKAKENNKDLLGKVVETIALCEGRVIVSGIGKSGHIGKKIAATLASTGTPSFFVHSTESLHGDSGMFVAGDVAILISYSGTTAEVVQLANMLAERGIKTVAMTKSATSPLAEKSDLFLDISVEREADPLNLAPSASTTVTLMLGDSIASALMNIYEFEPKDFKFFHPGGALGVQLSGGEK